MKKSGIILMLLLAMVLFMGQAQAADFHFTGNITYNTDIIYIPFSLDTDATNVAVWTNSYQNGTNFDPITSVWNATTGDLIGSNDDNSSIAPDQTMYDSGLTFSTLFAGDYYFTIGVYNNFPNSDNLSYGFEFDGTTPVPISEWWDAYYGYNHPGSFYSVYLSGVDSAVNDPTHGGGQVPEPATMLLLGSGLIGLGGLRKRFVKK